MIQVIYQEQNKIEFGLSEEISRDEFIQIIHQLESLAASHHDINVLFDAAAVTKYDFKIVLDEFDFYKKYKTSLKRVAIVSDLKFESFLISQLNKLADVEFKSYAPDKIEDARKWIFPSRLP
jgi:hypothetical protein